MVILLNIREIRLEKGITQQQIADELNVHKTVISSYELEKLVPSLSRLVEIALFLNVSLDDLVSYHKTHNRSNNELLIMKNK